MVEIESFGLFGKGALSRDKNFKEKIDFYENQVTFAFAENRYSDFLRINNEMWNYVKNYLEKKSKTYGSLD